VWPQCWDLQGPRGLEQRDLRNQNLGDLKKGPNGGVSPTPQKKSVLSATVPRTASLEFSLFGLAFHKSVLVCDNLRRLGRVSSIDFEIRANHSGHAV
jgi:hypothetical protein